jgi:hypothetical protein
MTKLQSLVRYFENNIRDHNRVKDCSRLPSANKDEYIYEILRTDDFRPVKVYISGAYEYTSGDYAARPSQIKAGDFILVNTFVPGANQEIVEEARQDRIAIGPWRKLYGALNSHEMWKYRMPEEKSN